VPRITRNEPYPTGAVKGEIPAGQQIDARTTELIDRAVRIEQEDARAAGTISFVSRIFCQCALPYREPALDKETQKRPPEWIRQNGTVTMILRANIVDPGKPTQDYQYPFGVMPRYLLAWMATEVKQDGPAMQDDGLTLDLGGSMRAFLRQIGINSGSAGRGGSATRLRDQVTRLATSSILVTDTREHGGGIWNFRAKNFGFVDETELWWSDRDRDTDTLWPNTIRLSEAWRDSIKASAVPLDTRALALIQKAKAGPLALDLYYWLAHRMFTVRETTTVPWDLLAGQFGSQYTRTRAFKAAVVKAFHVVKLAYPSADVTVTDQGLMLRPSPTPVARQTVIDARVAE
jgi:hypothetical protein